MTAMLAFHGVTGARGHRMLFEALSFRLAPGDAALVTGPNGAGKSTLIRIAAGLLRPAAGRVDRAAPCALFAEAGALDPDATLGAALGFWARLDGLPAARDRVQAELEALALQALADVPVRLLSTGQRHRAALARVAVSQAPMWLLDEPANGLDAGAVGRLSAMIARHRAGGGVVLAASHISLDLPDAVPIRLGEVA